jgi:hypothetical protein
MPKILYLVTEDWFFVSHFLPMAQVARDCGFEVLIATRVGDAGKRLAAEGFRVIPVSGRARQPQPVARHARLPAGVCDRARRAPKHCSVAAYPG